MKVKRFQFLFLIICFVFVGVLLGACSNNEIKILGDFEQTIEVNSKFTDLGVSCSNDYNVITEGEVNTSVLGRYQLTYKVYTSDGELLKELSRYVNVVDSTAPTYEEKTNTIYYAGYTYNIDDFITYNDNYDNKATIKTDFTSMTFTSQGSQLVTIKLTDSSNNETNYVKRINVVLDLDKLVRDVYKNQQSKITTHDTATGKYNSVQIDSETSFAYWDNGSIHFLKRVQSAYGSYASIQISATQYGKFNNANVDYHINNNGQYSANFAYIDATRKYSELTISAFSSTINNLNLDESDMLNECNLYLLDVLNEFQEYMTNTLHLDIK